MERFTCAICLLFPSETKPDYFVSTPGGHIFHYNCISKVIERDDEPVCPICEEPICEETLTRLHGIACPEVSENKASAPDPHYDHAFKIVLVGDAGVGKSAIRSRFSGKSFQENGEGVTVGVELISKFIQVGDTTVKLNIWDSSGEEKYRAFTPSYVRNAQAILIVYSVTDMISFNHLNYWMTFVNDHAPDNAVKILIGNKVDQGARRQVTASSGQDLSQQAGITFFETSAKDAYNIEAALRSATAEILEKPCLVHQADNLCSRHRLRTAERAAANRSAQQSKRRCC